MRRILVLFFTALTGFVLKGQTSPLTVAEKSDFKSTSAYSDVIAFIDQLKSPYLRIEYMATSAMGKKLPLMIIGNPLPHSPAALANDKRAVVYIQANIHAGEVEGKEATLMFVRDLLKNNDPPLLKNVVLLICPIFNPDGNDQMSTTNRTNQNGPASVGVRYNGEFLDLNRDAMKAESPEVRGLINTLNKWDPSVFMDCHTTDGSFHVEPVTFCWMVNPAGDNTLISYMREKMMPGVSKALSEKYRTENCFYGEFIDMLHPENGWILDASEPRYIVNYIGLRNRLGILNENYVYADFKTRVIGCYNLLNSLIEYTSAHSSEIKNLVSEADKRTVSRGMNPGTADSFPVFYQVRPLPEKVKIRTYQAELVSKEVYPNYRNTGKQVDVTVPYYDDYYPVKSVRFPFAYMLTVPDRAIISLLKIHGIRIEKLTEETKADAERFEIAGIKPSGRLNQGHYNEILSGKFISASTDFPAGTIVIRTAQPLANLAAYLLEPQTNDGLAEWNFLDKYLVPQWGPGFNTYPVYRIVNRTELKTADLK